MRRPQVTRAWTVCAVLAALCPGTLLAAGTASPTTASVATTLCPGHRLSAPLLKEAAVTVYRRLVRGYGLTGAQVRERAGGCLVVGLPTRPDWRDILRGVSAQGEIVLADSGARRLAFGQTIRLTPHGTMKIHGKIPVLRPVLTGAFAHPTSVAITQVRRKIFAVYATAVPAARVALCAFTRRHVGGFLAVTLDGLVATDPQIMLAICDGYLQILYPEGIQENAYLGPHQLANALKFGPLPTSFRVHART